MKTKLIQTKDYILIIDEKDEIKPCRPINVCMAHKSKPCDKCGKYQGFTVIAYYPLTKEAKELDLPLLPNPFEEEDIEKLAIKSADYNFESGNSQWINGFIDGYKTAQSDKQFSLEDMKKAIEMAKNSMGVDNCGESCYSNKTNEEIIQSLSQQLPKEFIPKYEANIDNSPYTSIKMNKALKALKESSKIGCKLKTIINSEGREVLVGTYKY